MRYLIAALLCNTCLPAMAGDADSNAALRYKRMCVVADVGPVMPYVRYGQAYGLQTDVSRMMQLGGEVHFNKQGRLTTYVAGLRVGYVYIKTHYHSYMTKPYEAPSQNLQVAALGGLRGVQPVYPWLDIVAGAQAGPVLIMSTEPSGAVISAYGEAHAGFRFNHRITTGVKFFLSPGMYRQYYDGRSVSTVGYGVSGLVSEVRIELGKRK